MAKYANSILPCVTPFKKKRLYKEKGKTNNFKCWDLDFTGSGKEREIVEGDWLVVVV